MTRRLAAAAALLLVALALALAVSTLPRGLAVVACAGAAGVAAWIGILRRGPARVVSFAAAGLLLAGSVAIVASGDGELRGALLIAAVALAVSAARLAFAVQVHLPRAAPPHRPVLFWNPRSGGGKATRFNLPDEARARGIEPIELGPGSDLEELVNRAVAGGADALAMAGGDGSQAVVARLAAEHGLPYACVPAGTRNHFALDLGVDREDVVGALDAFVDGCERRVDLAEVNGRVFVNNVSLGVYADAVQRPGYRDAKVRTILNTLPEALGPDPENRHPLRWTSADGGEQSPVPAILVSNNAYRLGRVLGSGTRPRVDAGLLGVAVLDAPHARGRRPWRDWTAERFEVGSDAPVNAGIDGEAVVLEPPLRFASRPGVLRVRIAQKHPGASPSAAIPDSAWDVLRALFRIAAGRAPLPGAPDGGAS